MKRKCLAKSILGTMAASAFAALKMSDIKKKRHTKKGVMINVAASIIGFSIGRIVLGKMSLGKSR